MARKPGGRHARRAGSRLTPRRWLPFVILLAVIAAGVAVARQDPGPDPVRDRVASPSTRLPVSSRADALSTAFYCGGGSALGADGPAELSAVIAGAEDRGLTAEVTLVGSEGTVETTTVEVPADGRVRVTAAEHLTADWAAMTIEVLGGRATVEREVRGPQGFDVSPCATSASADWFVPSGSTLRGATEYLLLYNPFPDTATVDLAFATDDGTRTPRAVQGVTVPGRSVRLIPPTDLPTRRSEVATRIRARAGRLVVDRVQVFDGTGDPLVGVGDDASTTPAPVGLASTVAVSATAPRWVFPDAALGDGARAQVAVYNPTSKEARVDVVVTYEDPERQGEVEPIQLTIPARQEEVVDLTDAPGLLRGVPFTVDVRSLDGVGVVAEQLAYGAPQLSATPVAALPADEADDGGEATPEEDDADEAAPEAATALPPVDGFFVVAGSPVEATGWLLASRGTSSSRAARVVVANLGSSPVQVEVAELVDGRHADLASASITIPAGDRRSLTLTDAAAASALIVTADGPIVVSHTLIARSGTGIAQALATPFPETVTPLALPG